MKNLNVSTFLVVTVVLFTCFFLNCNRASALIVDVLAGVDWTSATGFSGFGSNNTTDEAATFTDGATHPTTTSDAGTYEYVFYGAGAKVVVYDLGSATRVNELGIWAAVATRGIPETLNIDFSNDAGFSTYTTDVVHLINNLSGTGSGGPYYQTVLIGGQDAQYVRFNFPVDPNYAGPGLPPNNGGDGYYYTQNDQSFATVSQLELYYVPEPASLSLLDLGGLLILRRRR